ncbi:RNA polymerase sigma factor FliA [Helicobacter bilis]|uniref:RNA polymerase sigma factor FliA n=1 Tax=Helicobacter bilis TaxID=37372 RepID=A0A4U8U8A2_9HELI|nr:RNA polymerase sigma factor FliA [Helicobacter bilis]MCI7410882.1 RNA polymerase sigma factor FliA [Helicobacter bilis]MDD7297318.1 RNA polymerase sigma factor FliA [Helicobacter bilis]MDY4399464.1 RNA polymerase sigma factor FliA [Helicobacter bilis]TLE07934.1 RNA polymerase sigma factor FliA [Helicobacter bilis]TLE10086.1 RNA polymerase sigma factor FliA [Helicobacter bilis]
MQQAFSAAARGQDAYNQYLKNTQDELALQYLPAVKAMAFRLKERLPSSVDMNDLVSIGTEELIKLARRYDSNKNDSFWGYAKTRVNGAMLDYLRTLDIVSRASRKLIKAIEAEVSRYFNEFEEEPSNEYLAKVLNEDIEKIHQARLASDIYAVVPLDEQFNALEDGDILQYCEQKELMEIIQKVLAKLTEREQLIIQLYYLEELSLSEISEVLDITESRISQISKEVIKKIRREIGEANG